MGEITLLNIKVYYRSVVIKIVCYWWEDSCISSTVQTTQKKIQTNMNI